jgi:hypothetical protein
MASALKPSTLSLLSSNPHSKFRHKLSLLTLLFSSLKPTCVWNVGRFGLVDYSWVWIVGRSGLGFSQIGAYFGEKARLYFIYLFIFVSVISCLVVEKLKKILGK